MNNPTSPPHYAEALRIENERLRLRLEEAEQVLGAIREGAVDALVVAGPKGDNVFTLVGSDHNYRLLIESIDEGAITATADGTILYCNSKFAQMVNQPSETLIGLRMGDFLIETERQRFAAFLHEGTTHSAKQEFTLTTKHKTYLTVQASVGLLDVDGLRGVSIILTDLTQTKMAATLRKSNDELNQSNAELARFAFVASHDLKEPLRVISNYVQMLQKIESGNPNPLSKKYMRFITESVDRLYALIEDLLSYSRIGAIAEEPLEIDLNQVMRDVILNLESAIEDSRAKINCPTLPAIVADRSHLVQLFQNLIGNAIKYRGTADPEIKIECYAKNNEVRLSVSDNGIGIDPIHFDKIFVLFQRLHEKGRFSGTGIGLAVCKKIIDRLGGRIWVESAIGKGSKFFFVIPTATPRGLGSNA